VQPTHFNLWKNLFDIANHHVSNGMMAARNKKRNCDWRHWTNFLWPNFDPYLQDLNSEERISVVQAFVEWVRQGNISRGLQIRAGSGQDTMLAISKTFESAGPLYQTGSTAYHIRIKPQTHQHNHN